MLSYTKPDYSGTCRVLEREAAALTARVRVSEQNMKLKDNLEKQMSQLSQSAITCNQFIDLVKPMLADTKEYIDNKRRESMGNINNALRLAGEIIKDSAEGTFFQLDGDEAWLSTKDGMEVDMTEGGGFRQISSVFIRSAVLSANPSHLRTMLLDEMFSTVSVQNSAVLSLYLNVICQDMQVISIEQKPQVYSNIDAQVYTFNKLGDISECTHTELKRETTVERSEDGTEKVVQSEGVI